VITPEQIADHRAILVRIIQRGMRFTVGDAKLALAMLDEHALLSEVADAADSATRGGFELPRLRAALDALEANRVPPRPFAAADESVKRCEVCDWPMDREHGCHPGDCAYRPTQGTPEYARIRARRVHLAAQQPATAPAPSLEAQLAPVVDESEPPEGAMKTMWSGEAFHFPKSTEIAVKMSGNRYKQRGHTFMTGAGTAVIPVEPNGQEKIAGQLADTEVWLNVGNGFVTVAVVGIDDRMISSVESALKSEAEDHGADIDDNNPREVERFLPKSEYGAASYAYTGFSAEGNGDPSDTRDLVARLKKEAEQHSWVGNVRIQRGWPRI